MTQHRTRFGSLQHYEKGGVEVIKDDPRNYVFSNVFEVASKAKPYEKVAVGKNIEYVIEAIRAEGTSGWRVAAQDEFRAQMMANPMRWFDRELPGLVAEARTDVAGFLGANPEQLAFVSNVSAGVSAIATSLRLELGDEVLSTDHIYGAVSSAVDRLCARTGATRVVADVPVECSEDEVVDIFADHCSERTRLVVVDHVTSVTAKRFPIERLAHLAHQRGAMILVDAAHAPGMLPVDVPEIGADFWVGNLHKWACAPPGTGVLWVAPAWQEQMLPLVVSWGDADGFPNSFDRVGTDDLSAWLAAPSALWLFAKIAFFMFAFLWVRATFPRFRYDQIMRLGWKVFIPITLVWIAVVGVMMMEPFASTWPFSIWFGK